MPAKIRRTLLHVETILADDELIVALGASVGGRPHHRIGDRYEDFREMGRDVENPAGL